MARPPRPPETGRAAPARLDPLLAPLALAQAALGLGVLLRLLRTAGGQRIARAEQALPAAGTVAVLVPVLNERARLTPCLEGLIAQGPEVAEILVLDGGSEDGTQDLVASFSRRDPRLRLLDASQVPADWNGKAWGLQVGLAASSAATTWLLTIDADVRPRPLLVRSLLAHAARFELSALSVATAQELAGADDGLVHPALLTTLVYRFGIPGQVAHRPAEVQANGQCMLLRRALLESVGGFRVGRSSRCEDVTLARHLASIGQPIGFFESDGLVSTGMYASGREAWQGWTRSLPLHDRFAGFGTLRGLLEVALVQALPLPLSLLLAALPPDRTRRWALRLNLLLSLVRLGVLAGTARAYLWRPWTYWLSPLLDLPVALALWRSLLRRRHTWRGRVLVPGAYS
jgi:dolichol-phosphate mannosyltransferase